MVTPSMITRTVPPAAATPMIAPVAKGAEPELEPEVDVAEADVEAEVKESVGLKSLVMVSA